MSEQRYRTLHTPAAAEDLMDESEWKYQQLLKRMGVLERETKLQAQRSEQKIAELNRRNQSLTERNERNEQQSARRIEELERKNRELKEQNKKNQPPSVEERPVPEPGEPKPGDGRPKSRWLLLPWIPAAVGLIIVLFGILSAGGKGQTTETRNAVVDTTMENTTVSLMTETGTDSDDLLEEESQPADRVIAEGATYIPGTYTGTATGIGEVTVTMTFDENSITEVMVDVSNETETIGGLCGDELAAAILMAQSSEIDAISGATVTSNAVMKAAADCIAQANG